MNSIPIGHLADKDQYVLNWLRWLCGEPAEERYFDENGHAFNPWLQERRRSITHFSRAVYGLMD